MKKITLFLVSLLFAGALWAQNVQVSGVVTDTDGHPVIGASVVVKGTGVHATTDVNGKYTIATPANAVLSFTMMGMQAQDVQVSGRTLIDVTLSTDAVALEEVLVVIDQRPPIDWLTMAPRLRPLMEDALEAEASRN